MFTNRLDNNELLKSFAKLIVASKDKDDRDTALWLWEDERGHLSKLLEQDRLLGIVWGEYVVQWFKSFADGGFEGIQRDAHFHNDVPPHPLQVTYKLCEAYWEDPALHSTDNTIPRLPPIGMLLCDARGVVHHGK